MSRAKITAAQGYRCAPDGHTIITIPQHTIVEGRVAEWAIADRAASRMFDPVQETAAGVELETKDQPKRRGRPRKVQE